jgi:Protein phosphatase 2C
MTSHAWDFVGGSVQGAQHKRAGKPNQDSIKLSRGGVDGLLILAVSDGHGADPCFRSHIGSELAVESAVKVLAQELTVFDREQEVGMVDDLLLKLPRLLSDEWLQRVTLHSENNPFDASERELLAAQLLGPERQRPLNPAALAYGATLLAVALTKADFLSLHLGDGEILYLMDDSEEIRSPLPIDPGSIANETASLCMPDASWRFRVRRMALGAIPPRLILVTTDGYPNSFATPGDFARVGQDVRNDIFRRGANAVRSSLQGWLDQASLYGSGDDCTVGVIWRKDPEVTEEGGDGHEQEGRAGQGDTA